jgi:hypothetical protein
LTWHCHHFDPNALLEVFFSPQVLFGLTPAAGSCQVAISDVALGCRFALAMMTTEASGPF